MRVHLVPRMKVWGGPSAFARKAIQITNLDSNLQRLEILPIRGKIIPR